MDKAVVVAILMIGFLVMPVEAAQVGIVINGKAIHLEQGKKPLNEENWGTGIQVDFDSNGSPWQSFASASALIDSVNNTSYVAAYGLRRHIANAPFGMKLQVGGAGIVMTRKTFNNNQPFPAAMPVLTLANQYFAINTTYAPKITDSMIAFYFFQLVYYLPEF